MNSKTLIIGIIVLVGVLGVMAWTGGDTASLPVQSQLQSGTVLVSSEGMHNFGTIKMNEGNVITSYTVTNPTDADVRVDSIVTSCMCTTAYVSGGENKKGPYGMPGHGNVVPRANEIIKAGESRVIEVVFDPAAHGPLGVGRADRSVYLIDEAGGALELKFTAEVIL